jgi:dynein heavy chain
MADGRLIFSSLQMGWRPMFDSYMISIPDAVEDKNKDIFSKLLEDHQKLIQDLFNWLVQPCLDFVRLECKLFITTSPLHLVFSLLNLYTCILDDFITAMEGNPIAQKQVSTIAELQHAVRRWFPEMGTS